MRTGASLPGVGNYNEKVVLHAIRTSGGASQTTVVAETGLATQTVSVIVNQLLAKGEIRVVGVERVGRGRPRTVLEIVPEARFALGIHVDPALVTLVVLNLAGQVVGVAHSQILSRSPEEATGAIAEVAKRLVAETGIDSGRLLGACVAAPGAIDDRRGSMVRSLWMPDWDAYPLRDRLARLLAMPVDFVKDTRAAVTGETWLRAGAADDASLVFLYIGTGTGVGVSVNGEAMSGATGNSGEIGRLLVTLGPADAADTYAGRGMDNDPTVLVRRAIRTGVLDGDASLSGGLAAVDEAFRRLCAQARHDPGCRSLLEAAGRRAGAAAAVVAEIIDADEVVFGGPYWDLVSEFYLPECERVLSELGSGDVLPVRVSGSVMGRDVGAIGAAARVLDGHYVPRTSSLAVYER